MIHHIPQDLPPYRAGAAFQLIDHVSREESFRSKITLGYNLINFMVEGKKWVKYPKGEGEAGDTQLVMLPAGNCLMTERILSARGQYHSMLLFFEASEVAAFYQRYPHLLSQGASAGQSPDTESIRPSFLVMERDMFTENLLHSLMLLCAHPLTVPQELLRIKFEELMLYLHQQHPGRVQALLMPAQEPPEAQRVRQVAEANALNALTVEELAFLCNTSVSSFKRHFARLYGQSPSRWMLHKRMEKAAWLLRYARERPSEVYHQVGYENLSSFIESFRKVYGVTPGAFQEAD